MVNSLPWKILPMRLAQKLDGHHGEPEEEAEQGAAQFPPMLQDAVNVGGGECRETPDILLVGGRVAEHAADRGRRWRGTEAMPVPDETMDGIAIIMPASHPQM